MHKYLYVHGDPANLIDPLGLMSLGGISVSMGISANMRATGQAAVFGAAKGFLGGAAIGGVVGGVDAWIGGEDWKQGALNGAFWGGILGATLGLGSAVGAGSAFWGWLSPASRVVLKYGFYAFDFLGTAAGVAESYYNGDTAQGWFRAVLGFGIFKLIGYIPTCFVAGTKVIVQDPANPDTHHSKSIEEIKVGEYVLARDECGVSTGWKRVEETFSRVSDHLRIVEIQSADETIQTLKTTNEHPFWVEGRGWSEAHRLERGDVLVHADGASASVINTYQEPHNEGVAVFNLRIADYHSYFVAESDVATAILVHNANYGQILSAVRAGANTADEAKGLDEALHAVKFALDDLSEGKAKFLGVMEPEESYSSTAGVSKWFRIEPAEPWVGNDLPHIKFQDNATGKSGHVWISQSEYDALVAGDEDLLAAIFKYFED